MQHEPRRSTRLPLVTRFLPPHRHDWEFWAYLSVGATTRSSGPLLKGPYLGVGAHVISPGRIFKNPLTETVCQQPRRHRYLTGSVP
jgi:hypothetical protein